MTQPATSEECGCRTCLDVDYTDGFPIPKPSRQRMVLCAICGNKRCPHAEWHGFACTDSNAPDQVPLPAAAPAEPAGGEDAVFGDIELDALLQAYRHARISHAPSHWLDEALAASPLVGLLSRQYLDLKARHQQLEKIAERLAKRLNIAITSFDHHDDSISEEALADYAAWKEGKEHG